MTGRSTCHTVLEIFFIIATNLNSSFINNEGYSGAINSLYDVNIINIETQFRSNTGHFGGAIHLKYQGRCINSDSSFQNNVALFSGGAIYSQFDVEVENNGSVFFNNTAKRVIE